MARTLLARLVIGLSVFTALISAASVAVDATARPVHPREVHRARLLSMPFATQPIPCPCEDTSLCAPLNTSLPPKEIFAFQVEGTNWPRYDWNRLTTVALYDGLDPAMICMAHTRNVRLVWAVTFPKADLLNTTARQAWLDGIAMHLTNTYTDGVNFDFESPVDAASPEFDALTTLVQQLRDVTKRTVGPQASVTFDVAWSAHSIDGRAYNYTALIQICDFVVLMDYDTRSQVFGGPPCYGGPNTPINTAYEGIASFLELPGSSVSKLALGVPWYGYNYPCLNPANATTDECQILSVPFRGVACSDAAGTQWGFNTIQHFMRRHADALFTPIDVVLTGKHGSYATVNINASMLGANAHADGGASAKLALSKMFWDVPATLQQKYVVARDFGLRGVSMWAVDFLEKSPSGPGAQDTRDMWRALDHFTVL